MLWSGVPAMLLLCGIASKLILAAMVQNPELSPLKPPLPLAGEGWGGGIRQQRTPRPAHKSCHRQPASCRSQLAGDPSEGRDSLTVLKLALTFLSFADCAVATQQAVHSLRNMLKPIHLVI